jgi:hypothetical protein
VSFFLGDINRWKSPFFQTKNRRIWTVAENIPTIFSPITSFFKTFTMVYWKFGKINNLARNRPKSVLSMIWHGPFSTLISQTPRHLKIWYGSIWRFEGWTFRLIYGYLGFATFEKKFHAAVRNFFGTCLKLQCYIIWILQFPCKSLNIFFNFLSHFYLLFLVKWADISSSRDFLYTVFYPIRPYGQIRWIHFLKTITYQLPREITFFKCLLQNKFGFT